jgi:proteasome lid subunit RPN8/RPN11
LIQWQDMAAPVPPTVENYLAQLYATDADGATRVRAALATRAVLEPASPTPLVALHTKALASAWGGVQDTSQEQGGLLLGCAWSGRDGRVTLVQVRAAVPSSNAQGSALSLSMPTAVWDSARAELQDGETVVGWYHSHPGIGAFFSSTDRNTQAAFFNHRHSLGWVIDPVRREQAWFAGAHALALMADNVLLVGLSDEMAPEAASPTGPPT